MPPSINAGDTISVLTKELSCNCLFHFNTSAIEIHYARQLKSTVYLRVQLRCVIDNTWLEIFFMVISLSLSVYGNYINYK